MQYSFNEFKKRGNDVTEHLKRELLNIQTGRATPGILDSVRVEVYGSAVPVTQIATVGIEDAKTLRIVPWDTKNLQPLEQAVRAADLNLGISVDGQGMRVSFPELTTDTRERYVKIVRQKLEEAKIILRSHRDEIWNDIQKKHRDGDMGEDDKFRFKEEMERMTKESSDALDGAAEKKEKEIMGA